TSLPPPTSPLFPYTTLFRSELHRELARDNAIGGDVGVASGRKRHGGIEERLGLGDHLVAACLVVTLAGLGGIVRDGVGAVEGVRSEEHTSELQSLRHLVCRL